MIVRFDRLDEWFLQWHEESVLQDLLVNSDGTQFIVFSWNMRTANEKVY